MPFDEETFVTRGKEIMAKTGEQVLPWSGQLVDLSTPEGALEGYQAASDFRKQLNDFAAMCREAIIAESDRLGQLTFEIGDQKVRVDSDGEEYEYDVAVLATLKDAGLPEFRFNELVSWEPKVNQRVANQLLRNPEYAAIIEDAVLAAKPKRRSVRMGG